MKLSYRLIVLLMMILSYSAFCRNKLYSPNVKSLQTVVNQDWLSYPTVMRLNTDDVLNISFDELSHDYHRYIYHIEHCEADWNNSEELFETEWLEGFNDNTIDDYSNSINTIIPYTHYWFQIPNDKVRLKMSGNYRLYVIDEDQDDNQPILKVEFMVTEQSMNLSLSCTTNTDIDTNVSHQQMSMSLGYGNHLVTNPEEQIRCIVMQNGRFDNCKDNPMPNFINANGLEWSHNRGLIFDAGNEYHKFEVLDVSHPTMGVEHIRWDGANYQVFPFISEYRNNYIYDEDANGAFYIRNSDNRENDIFSEYVWVNYLLKSPKLSEGSPLIDGQWTTDENSYSYIMEYDEDAQVYHTKILQKQGYYSYQYLWMREEGNIERLPSEGSFYQTENTYQAFIYYKGTGERSWRLVAFRQLDFK